jgi:mono/diheme cytochrome c family protein
MVMSVPRIALVLATGTAAVAAAGCGQQLVSDNDNLVAGKQMFVSKCGSCHTLARANTKGTVGPNLDAAFRRALADGQGRTTVRGIVHEQILFPATLKNHSTGTQMPAKLVDGQNADDVAAYVAGSVALPGQDAGVLGDAVKAAGGGQAAVEKNGVLQIDADPTGQLAYVTNKGSATPGALSLQSQNKSSTPHDIAITGNGVNGKGPVVSGGKTSSVKVNLKPGTYTFFCSVPGHRQAGMQGKIVVK